MSLTLNLKYLSPQNFRNIDKMFRESIHSSQVLKLFESKQRFVFLEYYMFIHEISSLLKICNQI
jgi:hypothetical protein